MRDVQTVAELHFQRHHLTRHPNCGHAGRIHPRALQEQPDPSGEGQGPGHVARRTVVHAQRSGDARSRLLLRR